MIINFSIQNFGSIKDKQTLSFEANKLTHLEDYYIIQPVKGLRLLKLGLIYGANASGKTTILKALDFLREIILKPKREKTDSFTVKPFLFDNDTANQNSILSIEFIQNGIRYYYEVELNEKAIVKEELNFFNPSKVSVFKRTTDLDNQFSEITFGSKIKIDKIFEKTLAANTLWNNTVPGGFLKTNMESKELKDVSDWFSNYLQPLVFSKTDLEDYVTVNIYKAKIKKETVIDILKKADFNISNILIKYKEEDVSAGSSEEKLQKKRTATNTNLEFVHTVHSEKYSLPFNIESQGTQRYYGLAGILASLIKNSVAFPIDELEASLHPDLFVHFLLSFLVNAKNSQIIATTHNREILNNNDVFRNDAIWIADKSKDSATDLYSLADFDISEIRDSSNIYNAYKIGKLGGVPNLGDYFIDIDDENT
jgi:AAA15 family ATPase/GTPase